MRTFCRSACFELKRGIELNPRNSILFSPSQIQAALADRGFVVRAERAEFLLPTVLHRWADQATLSRLAEAPGRADRRAPSA